MARILIVDDIELNIDLLQQFLEDDYELCVARSGAEAIEKVKSDRPDLVLMDIALPGMTGLQAMQQIRQEVSFETLPIIAVTSHAMRGDRANALAAGFDDYLSKPVDDLELLRAIESQLSSGPAS